MGMDLVDSLMKAGFTRHEAVLYLTLSREGELTGYEAAKISNIPRSNAYLALAGLVEKGGAFRIDGDSSKYTAIPAKELIFNIRKQLEEVYRDIEENTPLRAEANEPYVTITGKRNAINKMSHIISHSTQRIYISTSPKVLEYIRTELEEARDRGLKVVVITSPEFNIERVVRYSREKKPGQLMLIADTAHVLTGEICEAGETACLYSKNKNLIQVVKDSLANEIKLVQMQMNNTEQNNRPEVQ